MANSATSIIITILLRFLLLVSANSHSFKRNLSQKEVGRLNKEKLSHLHFYFHDIVSGKNPTVIRVAAAAATNTSSTGFGSVFMMDDLLTLKPDPKSKQVGRAQGIYASAAMSEFSFLMCLNFAFTDGKYNGSSLSVLGRNPVLSEAREMPVVGGSGLFRFARGYARAQTNWVNLTSLDAIVEYNVYVFHY